MASPHSFTIRVYAAWNDWRSADVPLSSLEGVHWHRAPGAPRSLLHAFVRCTDSLRAILQHVCDGSEPHTLHVCVLKRHTLSTVYEDLAHRADMAVANR
jgi:hypothetical protein